MRSAISKTSIDALGERLRGGNLSDDDLRQLDSYRRTFADAYESVISAVRGLDLEPTGRPAKSTPAIVAKLRRGSIRLSQMQDIAGCRLVIDDTLHQNRVIHGLTSLFDNTLVHDRREMPNNGYRGVHVIVVINDRAVEIQVRTALQHVWAELSEKLSDVVGPDIKYGMGDPLCLELLERYSLLIAAIEGLEMDAAPQKLLEMKQYLKNKIQAAIRQLADFTGG
ncbi:hypothetical protein [Immundisolibacter cernigliae]|uniref:RelA/SpoT domain-containing protein n=1 Tax=Immundisolibacter cernigliae TaxID=1810504 RepID=A0A1B1YQ05_9GAMM|nr:hypothetical protein [Immundisolibacter cernigliae]ANX02828.1 hypothetical protein PG2T_00525 [Immundisolibacter cernigliae]